MRVRRDPGSFWAPCEPRVAAGSASNRSWRRPGGGPEAQKIHVAPPGGLLGRKVDRFQLPGGGPGAPRSLPESLPESIFEASFLGAPPGTKKVIILMFFSNAFFVVFLDVVALVFCLPRRSPARRRKLKH